MIALERGITFNGIHSYKDKRMIMTERNISLPNKRKVVEQVPYSNVEYDFSGVFGSQAYDSREISYTFTLFNHGRLMNLEMFRIECANWLMGVNSQSPIVDDLIPNYHFLGEVRNGIECTFNSDADTYSVKVTFVCYPFKIADLAEGNVLWDPFCFATDVFQDVSFQIDGTLDFSLYNAGQNIATPTVTVNTFTGAGFVTLAIDGTSYDFEIGTSTNSEFALSIGENEIHAEASDTAFIANIEFAWYKEIL